MASGIKRISALVGPKVFEQIVERDAVLESIAGKLESPVKQIESKIDKILKEYDLMKSQIEHLEHKVVADFIAHSTPSSTEDLQIVLAIPSDMNFKLALNLAREKFVDQPILLATKEGTFSLLGTSQISAKSLAAKLGLK